MAAVTESFVESAGRQGVAIGIIPGSAADRGARFEYRTKGSAYPNPLVDVAIFTHLFGQDPQGEQSRNHINVLSADLVVALPGGAGTHAEIQLARKYGKPVILFVGPDDTILGKTVADLHNEGFTIVHDFRSLLKMGNRVLGERDRSLPVRIVLSECVVRSWEWTDAEALQRHANNRKISRNLHDVFPSPYTVRDARRWLAHALSASPETAFAIDVDGESVGGIGFMLKQGAAARSAEVGYWLGEPYWGRGITTECVRAVSSYVFENFPYICRLYAQVFPWNKASMRVLEKAGFKQECVLKKAAMKAGEVIDLFQFALIGNI
jgi:RimJ/RimL family protein N-acetyltransferase